jgi:uncharacterized protein
MHYEWDANKNESNIRKHDIRFADAVNVLEDENAITVLDDATGEQRFVTIGADVLAHACGFLPTARRISALFPRA